jgi:hypothetical protein
MEQHYLKQEETQQQATDRLSEQETLSAAQRETVLPVGNKLDPEVVGGLMRQLAEEEGSRADPRRMASHEREAVLAQLTRQARSQKRQRRWSNAVYAIGVTLFIGFNIAYISGYIKYPSSIMLPLAVCYGVAGMCAKLAERRWGRAAERMTVFDDLRAAGPLMEALDLRDPAVVAAAEKALSRLLPRLQASDASSITETQRECLYRRLKSQNAQTGAEFLIAALRALEQIGDATALPYVEALKARTGTTAGANRVWEAATHCLTLLKARAEQKQWSDNLLRPSSGQEAPSDALLRPATSSPPTDPQHLLRSSSAENERSA